MTLQFGLVQVEVATAYLAYHVRGLEQMQADHYLQVQPLGRAQTLWPSKFPGCSELRGRSMAGSIVVVA